jgi:hypothetical protein
MERAELLERLAQELTAEFGARFPATDYVVDSIPFYGNRTLKHFDIAADPEAIICEVMQALVAMKTRGQLRFHNDDFAIGVNDRSKILDLPPCMISIGADASSNREKITFRFDVEITAGKTRVSP